MLAGPLSAAFWALHGARNAPGDLLTLSRFPRLDPREQKRLMAARLLSRIRHFGARADALPAWRDAARLSSDALWEAWTSLPILTKQIVRDCYDPAEMRARFGLRGRAGSSGGSTGEPTHFLHDVPMIRASEAKSLYVRLRLGWRPGMTTVSVWGSDRDIGKTVPLRQRVAGALRRDRMVSGYELDQARAREVVDLVVRHRPVALYGFTSMLTFVARSALEEGLVVPPGSVRAAWNGGEMLTRDDAALFARAFGAPLHNMYGGREVSAIAYQLDPAGPLEVLRPLIFVEIVDESGRAVPAGVPGQLLVTSTVCGATPFLRYAIGDAAVAHEISLAGVVSLSEISGRISGTLKLPNGMVINNIFWNHLFKEYPEVHQFQVVVRTGGVLVRLRGRGRSDSGDASMRARFDAFLRGMRVDVSWVDRIPLTPRGKLLQVVDERGES